MNKCLFCGFFLVLLAAACKNKVKDTGDASGYFPVVSYLQSQVRQVDTALFSIIKITKKAGRQDTTYIRREDFKSAAQDFLSLPDIAGNDLKDDYTETKLYDEDLKKFVFTYLPKDKNDAGEITRQDVIIEPNAGNGDQVQTIYIETVLNKGDSTVQKKMTWNVNQSFQVIKLINKKNQPETVETTNVTWSDGMGF